jgi:hypothetical protein
MMAHMRLWLYLVAAMMFLMPFSMGMASEDSGSPLREADELVPRWAASEAHGGAPRLRELIDKAVHDLIVSAEDPANRECQCGCTVMIWSPRSINLYGDQFVVAASGGRSCRMTLVVGDDARDITSAREEITLSGPINYAMVETTLTTTDNGWMLSGEYRVHDRQKNSYPVGADFIFEKAPALGTPGGSPPAVVDAIARVACRPQLRESHLACTSERHLALYRDIINDEHIHAPPGTVSTVMINTCPQLAPPADTPMADLEWLEGPDGKHTLLESRYAAASLTGTLARILIFRTIPCNGTRFVYRTATWTANLWTYKTVYGYDRK